MIEEITHLIQAIPMWLSVSGSILMLVSIAILIAKHGKLGKPKIVVELCACLGAALSTPITFLTLLG